MVILEYSRGFGHDTNRHKTVRKQTILSYGTIRSIFRYDIAQRKPHRDIPAMSSHKTSQLGI
jgi:hypothetical protein